jgi:outer membrane protein OmpA-like peptidoglycan-associated protein
MRRAKSVRQALIDRGIETERIRIAWLGASELLVDCNSQPCTAADHALNRRAEIVVISANKQAEAVGQ